MNPEKIALYYKNGSSDKVYQAQLNAVEGGWMVSCQYGGRGKSLTNITKFLHPVHYDKAKKVYDTIIRQKIAKGYTPDGSGVAYMDTKNADRITEYLPQLLNDVTLEEILIIFRTGRPLWMQTKHDGERRGLLATDNDAIGANRKGLIVSLQEQIYSAAIALTRQCGGTLKLDTEDMGDHLVIFDVLHYGSEDLRPQGFGGRAISLARVDDEISRHSLGRHFDVDLPVRPDSEKDILNFIANARGANEEGVVFRTNAPITPGRPNSGGPVLKLKFWESATCRVISTHDTKRSIGISVWDSLDWVPIGNCTVPINYVVPEIGDLVEIKYLYAFKGGSLFEPSYKGKRDDLGLAAADINQLKYKK